MFDRMVIPEIASLARDGLPAPAETNDGNPWMDGCCWLYCGQRCTRVLWIGPANVAGMQAPMFACGPCIAELHKRLWQSIRLSDEADRLSHEVPRRRRTEPTQGDLHQTGSRLLRS